MSIKIKKLKKNGIAKYKIAIYNEVTKQVESEIFCETKEDIELIKYLLNSKNLNIGSITEGEYIKDEVNQKDLFEFEF